MQHIEQSTLHRRFTLCTSGVIAETPTSTVLSFTLSGIARFGRYKVSKCPFHKSPINRICAAHRAAPLILQASRRFTYVTAHSPTLRHFTSVTAHSPTLPFALPTSQLIPQPFFRFSYVTGFHLRHLASRPCQYHFFGQISVNHCSLVGNTSTTK